MNLIERFIYSMQVTMTEPESYGWFHLLCLFVTFVIIFILYKLKDKHSEKQLKCIIGIYGVTAFILELAKQVSWSFNYDTATKIITWDYEWYAFPFQLCSTPIYVCLICLFLNNNKVRKSLFSYLSFITIWGSIMTMIMPDTCLVDEILINIHTMWLHCGSFIISVYLIMTKEVELNIKSVKRSIIVFILFVLIAQLLNIVIYNLELLNDETFDMFYISPYFETTLPVFSTLRKIFPYGIYLLLYISALSLGSGVICLICILINKVLNIRKAGN